MTKKSRTVQNPELTNESAESDLGMIEITLPVGNTPDGVHVRGHVNVQLDATQRRGLRRLQDGLNQRNIRLQNGRHVGTAADAVRWLTEVIEQRAVEDKISLS